MERVRFWASDWKAKNFELLNLGSPILKPFPLYKDIMLEALFRRNIDERHKDEWRLKDAMCHDSERRLTDGCNVCITSKYNNKPSAEEWLTYKHCHY